MVRVDDVRGVLEIARSSNGADASDTAHDRPYGERQAAFVDPFGHRWVMTQTLQEVDPRDWGGETVVPRCFSGPSPVPSSHWQIGYRAPVPLRVSSCGTSGAPPAVQWDPRTVARARFQDTAAGTLPCAFRRAGCASLESACAGVAARASRSRPGNLGLRA